MNLRYLFLICILSLVVTGCNFLQPQQALEVQEQAQETASQLAESQQNPLTSIKDAFLADQPMRCVYQDEQGQQVTTTVFGDKMRVEGVNVGEENTRGWMISDGTWMYIWSEGQTTGMKYNLEQMKQKVGESTASDNYQDPDEWVNEVDTKYQVDCTPVTARDDEFTPPSDVQFQDLNLMLEGLQQNMNNEELQKMVEQYQQ